MYSSEARVQTSCDSLSDAHNSAKIWDTIYGSYLATARERGLIYDQSVSELMFKGQYGPHQLSSLRHPSDTAVTAVVLFDIEDDQQSLAYTVDLIGRESKASLPIETMVVVNHSEKKSTSSIAGGQKVSNSLPGFEKKPSITCLS